MRLPSRLGSIWPLVLILLLAERLLAQPADLISRKFPRDFDSSGIVFQSPFVLSTISADGGTLSRATFAWDVPFKGDFFRAGLDCRNIFFPDDVDFSKTVFRVNSDFTRDTFSGLADFTNAKFLDQTHFVLATFTNYADFSRAVFRGIAYFSSMSLTDSTVLDFTDATLPDTLDFSDNSRIPLEINLSAAAFRDAAANEQKPDKHWIYLSGSDISRFRLDYRHFQLLFTDPKTGKHLTKDEKESIYESLLKNFQDHGQLESYKILYIEFQDYEWSTRPAPIRWLYFIPHYWNFYGQETGLIFLWTFVFLFLFTLINYRYLDFLSSCVYPVEKVTQAAPVIDEIKAMPKQKEKLWLSWERFWASLVYTGSIFFRFSLDMDRFSFTRKMAAFYLIVVYTIGVICIAYMANFVITK